MRGQSPCLSLSGMVRKSGFRRCRYTLRMDRSHMRAEELLTLSGAARRLADVVAAAETPLRYEVMRHLARVSEETMTEVLDEAVHARLIRRGEDAFTYVAFDDETAAALREGIGEQRIERMRAQIASATRRVFEQ